MTRLYRVLRKAFAHAPFEGEGPYRHGGRWSSSGTRLSYASEHQSLANILFTWMPAIRLKTCFWLSAMFPTM
ncbi:MAG TPA: RES family NAD+ phosphorylase [Candidatus Polarisedimenticolia bacterium]|nr:RES family NAD+ phosphorylase [Candidatus Polarisedimenticolia bacterium]